MGFFSSIGDILGTLAPIATTALLGPVAGIAAQQALSPTVAAAAQTASPQEIARLQGTGGLRRRTIVQTFDPKTGIVVKSETFKGAPAVMQSDVAAANRLNRSLARLNKKQPRKIVKQSEKARLSDEVELAALRHARDSVSHNGHHNGSDPVFIRTGS